MSSPPTSPPSSPQWRHRRILDPEPHLAYIPNTPACKGIRHVHGLVHGIVRQSARFVELEGDYGDVVAHSQINIEIPSINGDGKSIPSRNATSEAAASQILGLLTLVSELSACMGLGLSYTRRYGQYNGTDTHSLVQRSAYEFADMLLESGHSPVNLGIVMTSGVRWKCGALTIITIYNQRFCGEAEVCHSDEIICIESNHAIVAILVFEHQLLADAMTKGRNSLLADSPGVMLIGTCGNPDATTLSFCNKMSEVFPHASWGVLSDMDVNGVNILMAIRKFAPNAEWLGLRPSQCRELGVRSKVGVALSATDRQQLQRIADDNADLREEMNKLLKRDRSLHLAGASVTGAVGIWFERSTAFIDATTRYGPTRVKMLFTTPELPPMIPLPEPLTRDVITVRHYWASIAKGEFDRDNVAQKDPAVHGPPGKTSRGKNTDKGSGRPSKAARHN